MFFGSSRELIIILQILFWQFFLPISFFLSGVLNLEGVVLVGVLNVCSTKAALSGVWNSIFGSGFVGVHMTDFPTPGVELGV